MRWTRRYFIRIVTDAVVVVVFTQFCPQGFEFVARHSGPGRWRWLVQQDRSHGTPQAMARPPGDVPVLTEYGFPLPRRGTEKLVVFQQRRWRLKPCDLTTTLLVRAHPRQIVKYVRKPGRIVTGCRQGFE